MSSLIAGRKWNGKGVRGWLWSFNNGALFCLPEVSKTKNCRWYRGRTKGEVSRPRGKEVSGCQEADMRG